MIANDTVKIFVWLPSLIMCAAIEEHLRVMHEQERS